MAETNIDQIVKYLGYDKKPELMARIYGTPTAPSAPAELTVRKINWKENPNYQNLTVHKLRSLVDRAHDSVEVLTRKGIIQYGPDQPRNTHLEAGFNRLGLNLQKVQLSNPTDLPDYDQIFAAADQVLTVYDQLRHQEKVLEYESYIGELKRLPHEALKNSKVQDEFIRRLVVAEDKKDIPELENLARMGQLFGYDRADALGEAFDKAYDIMDEPTDPKTEPNPTSDTASETSPPAEVDMDELARLTHEQGMGGIYGNYVNRIDPEIRGGGNEPARIFLMDENIGYGRARLISQMDLMCSVPRAADGLVAGTHILQTEPYNPQSTSRTQRGGTEMRLREYKGKHGEANWTKLQLTWPLGNDNLGRSGAYISFFVVVPPDIAKTVIQGVEANPYFIDRYIRTVFPDVIGNNPQTEIPRPKAQGLLVLAKNQPPQLVPYPQPVSQ